MFPGIDFFRVPSTIGFLSSPKSSPLTEAKGSSISQLWPITLIIVTTTLIVIRLLYVLDRTGEPPRSSKDSALQQPLSTLIVLGSGGHTAAMINLLSVLQKDRFSPRFYIAAITDSLSLQKARLLEVTRPDSMEVTSSSQFMQVYRSREVGQSYITSVWTTSVALAHALWLMLRIRPQVILCNGPGTCIPLCVIAFLFKNYAGYGD